MTKHWDVRFADGYPSPDRWDMWRLSPLRGDWAEMLELLLESSALRVTLARLDAR